MPEKQALGFLTRTDTNRPVQSQKQASTLKFRFEEEEGLYYPFSENKGSGYREADRSVPLFSPRLQSGFLIYSMVQVVSC